MRYYDINYNDKNEVEHLASKFSRHDHGIPLVSDFIGKLKICSLSKAKIKCERIKSIYEAFHKVSLTFPKDAANNSQACACFFEELFSNATKIIDDFIPTSNIYPASSQSTTRLQSYSTSIIDTSTYLESHYIPYDERPWYKNEIKYFTISKLSEYWKKEWINAWDLSKDKKYVCLSKKLRYCIMSASILNIIELLPLLDSNDNIYEKEYFIRQYYAYCYIYFPEPVPKIIPTTIRPVSQYVTFNLLPDRWKTIHNAFIDRSDKNIIIAMYAVGLLQYISTASYKYPESFKKACDEAYALRYPFVFNSYKLYNEWEIKWNKSSYRIKKAITYACEFGFIDKLNPAYEDIDFMIDFYGLKSMISPIEKTEPITIDKYEKIVYPSTRVNRKQLPKDWYNIFNWLKLKNKRPDCIIIMQAYNLNILKHVTHKSAMNGTLIHEVKQVYIKKYGDKYKE
jgi:hypothetical protein